MTPERLKLEEEIVASCVEHPREFARFSRVLLPEMFSSPKQRKIMAGLHTLLDAGVEINWINVENELGESCMPLLSHGYCDLNIASKRLSELIIFEKGSRLVEHLMQEDDAFGVLSAVNSSANELASIIAAHSNVPKSVMMERWIELIERNRDGNILRVPTGFPTLDRWCHGGLKLGNMTFLGGSPGAGKTSFMLKLGMNAGGRGFKSVLIEGEMPEDEILARLAGQFTKRPVHEIERGDHMDAVMEFADQFQRIDYEVKSTFERSVDALLAKIRQACHEGAKLILVDYLQVFVEKGGRANDEFTKIKALSEGLRKMTLVNNVHILAASSLNRLDHNTGKLTLNSFYGGSQLGHDCNTAFILHDEDDDTTLPDAKNKTIVCNVVKNRGGRTGEMRIAYTLDTQDMNEQADVQIVGQVPLPYNERHEDDEPFV